MFGSGDCVEPEQVVERLRQGVSGVFVGRGVLRNPWILAQALDLLEGRAPRTVSRRERAAFLHDYIDLLLDDRRAEREGFRHVAPGTTGADDARSRSRERWVVNKVRALCTWYTKGLDNGSHLRIAINAAPSIAAVRDVVDRFFLAPESFVPRPAGDTREPDAVLVEG